MSNKYPDYQTGIGGIIPSSQTSNRREGESLKYFKEKFGQDIIDDIKNNYKFPTEKELFVFIAQFFVSEKKYNNYDIDNISKTINDVLKISLCNDDNQIKVLLATKMLDKQVKEDFAYVSCSEIKSNSVPQIIKGFGYQRAITYYQTEVASKKY